MQKNRIKKTVTFSTCHVLMKNGQIMAKVENSQKAGNIIAFGVAVVLILIYLL